MSAPFRTATAFCEYVEGELGWCPPEELPRFRALMIEASKVKRRIAHDPELFTWDNLHLVVEFLKHKRLERSPAACVSAAWVAEARHKYVRTEPRVVDIAKSIAEAVAAEQGAPQGHEPWVNRLTRARGDGRQAVYSEWFETRGHLLETSG